MRNALLLTLLSATTFLMVSCSGFRASNDIAGVMQSPDFGRTGDRTWAFEFVEQDFDTTGTDRVTRRATIIALMHGWRSFSLSHTPISTLEAEQGPSEPVVTGVLQGRPQVLWSEDGDSESGNDWNRYEAHFSPSGPSKNFPHDVMALANRYASSGQGDAKHWKNLLSRVEWAESN